MVLLEVIPLVQIQLKLLERVGMSPFAFNSKSLQFAKIRKSSSQVTFFKLKVALIVGYVAFTTMNGIYHTSFISYETEQRLGLEDRTYKMFVLFFTLVFPAVCLTISPLFTITDDLISALNFILEFESEQPLEAKTGAEAVRRIQVVKVLLAAFTQLSITAPLGAIIFNVFQPTLLPFLGSLLQNYKLEQDYASLESGVIIALHLGIILFQTWFYLVTASSGFFMIGHVFVLFVFSLHNSLKLMTR